MRYHRSYDVRPRRTSCGARPTTSVRCVPHGKVCSAPFLHGPLDIRHSRTQTSARRRQAIDRESNDHGPDPPFGRHAQEVRSSVSEYVLTKDPHADRGPGSFHTFRPSQLDFRPQKGPVVPQAVLRTHSPLPCGDDTHGNRRVEGDRLLRWPSECSMVSFRNSKSGSDPGPPPPRTAARRMGL